MLREKCQGDDSCCSSDNICQEGEGDCDSDLDCLPGLVCGKDNCRGSDFDSTDDCCERPKEGRCRGGVDCCVGGRCGVGKCDVGRYVMFLSSGEGVCNSDSDCLGSLVCGEDNCWGRGFHSSDDCCQRVWWCGGADDCCTQGRKCGAGGTPQMFQLFSLTTISAGQGDCDSDLDCLAGLVCGRDNCRGAGFDSTDDCCR